MWADIPPPYTAPAYIYLAENTAPATTVTGEAKPKQPTNDEPKPGATVEAKEPPKSEVKLVSTPEIKEATQPPFTQKLGRCFATNTSQEFTPTEDADQYYARFVRGSGAHLVSQKSDGSYINTAILDIQTPPAHGKLVQINPKAINQQKYTYKYEPAAYFDGDDQFVINVTSGDKRVQVVYTLSVGGGPTQIPRKGIDGLEDGMVTDPARCPKEIWKIVD